MPGDWFLPGNMPIPEVDERLGQIGCSRSNDAQMRIMPGRYIRTAQVIASDETGRTVYDEQLEMLQRIATQVKHLPGAAYNPVGQDMHRWREDLEGVGHDQIAKAIEDYVDFHPLGGFAYQGLLEGLTDLVIFPDIGFEVDTLLSCIEIDPLLEVHAHFR